MFQRVEKGFLVNEVTGENRQFQFNPVEIRDSKGTAFERVQVPGLSHPRLQFVAGESRVLSFELEFSGVGNTRNVMDDVKWVQSLQYPNWDQGVIKAAPPRVTLVFGRLLRIRGVITGVATVYEQWNPALTRLLKSKVKIDLEEYVPKSVNMHKYLGRA